MVLKKNKSSFISNIKREWHLITWEDKKQINEKFIWVVAIVFLMIGIIVFADYLGRLLF